LSSSKFLLACGLAMFLAAPAADAQPGVPPGGQRLDGIAAVVNDDVVLESDVEEQLYLFLMNAQLRPDSAGVDTLRRQVLNQLIEEKLIVAEAKRQGLSVSDAEVQRAVDKALDDARQRLGGDAAFREQLARENTTEEKLREKYRADLSRQLLAERLVNRAVPQKPVTAAEAEAYFKANRAKFPRMPVQLTMQVVQIPATPDTVALARGRAKAEAARKRITGGEKFAKVAAEVSDDQNTARSGGDLGFFGRGTLDESLEAVVFTAAPGRVSEPVKSPFGWHLIEVIERDTLKSRAGRDSVGPDGGPAVEVHARHIMIRVPIEEADADRAKKLAEKVRAEALAGKDFVELSKRYSRYEGPQNDRGEVGPISVTALTPHIRAGLESLPVGGISEVLPNQIGYNIFRIIDRKPEREYELEEVRDELPGAVGQMKFRDRYETWVKGLRTKAHIEIRKT
jgi:peptidyl-prolyl cis-trans isomerase SurA